MALDDFAESEVAVAVAVTGLILSPKVRGLVRRGAIFGVAQVLKAGRAISSTPLGSGRDATDNGLEDIVAPPGAADAGTEQR